MFKSSLLATMLAVAGVTATASEFTVDGIKYNVTDSVAKTVEVIANNYQYDITIPETVSPDTITWTVTSIGVSAFKSCDKLYSVTLPNSITTIKNNAFSYSDLLSEVNLSTNLKTIGSYAFQSCDNLSHITLPEGISHIETAAFSSSALTSIEIPSSIIELGGSIFQNCTKLKSVKINDGLRMIPNDAFSDCSNLTHVELPQSLISIKTRAFQSSKIDSIIIPDGVTTIESSAFSFCKYLEHVVLPQKLTTISSSMFKGCTLLKEISLPNDILSIGSSAFESCTNLLSVYIPESTTTLMPSCFFACNSLKEIHLRAKIAPGFYTSTNYPFPNIIAVQTTLYVPKGTLDTYQHTLIWKTFSNIVEEDISVTLNEMPPIIVGTDIQMELGLSPCVLYLNDIQWSSSNKDVATIDNNGIVSAKSKGTTTIKITGIVGEEIYTAQQDINIIDTPENYFDVNNMIGYNNQTAYIPITMINTANIIAFQCDVYLPSGVEVSKIDDDYDITFGGRETRTHSINGELQANGSIRIAAFSSKNSSFSGNNGVIFNLPLIINTEDQVLTIEIKNIILVDENNAEILCPNLKWNIDVKNLVSGDANIDGKVTISDATTTVSYILGETPDPFLFAAADVTGDENITINDVTGIIDIVLGVNETASTGTASIKSVNIIPTENTENDKIYINDFTISAGETKNIEICLANNTPYTAFQCDIYLPEGLGFLIEDDEYIVDLSDRKSRSHTIATSLQPDGALRVVAFSSKNANFTGNDGALMIVPVIAGETIGNELEMSVKNNLFVSENAEYTLPDITAKINNATFIDDVANKSKSIITTNGNTLLITSPIQCQMKLYSIDGRYTTLDLSQGKNSFIIPNKGIYIIDGNKIVIK